MKARFWFVALICLTTTLSTSRAEIRKWTNKAGISIDAEMTAVDVTARTITIKRADGKEFTIPIETLSDADKTFASEQWKKMQAAPAAAAMPAPGAPALPATPGAPATATAPVAPAVAAAPSKRPAPPRPALTITPVAKFKAPAGADYLRTVPKTRPRLIHAAAGWNYLKTTAATDPMGAKILENIRKSGEKLLEAPELTRIFGEQLSASTPGSQALYRMAHLGVLNFVENDPRWKERGVRELISLTDPVTFQNWYPDDPRVTADFLAATALGYDWFRDGMNANQATAARTYMIEKGIGALVASLKGDDIPESAKGKAAGTSGTPAKAKAPAKAAAKEDKDVPPNSEHMAAAGALILAAICLVDEEPAAAKTAADAAAKVFGKGMMEFAPAGIWPEGMEAGDAVLDYAVMVMQTLRSCAGSDLGFSTLEGIPQTGLARLHLVGPTDQFFNYGDATGLKPTRNWVSTWLAGVHGNMGTPGLKAGAEQGPTTAFFGLAGHFLYFNPSAAGDGTPDSMDYASPNGPVATVRSGWDNKAYYLAVKGGDNSVPTAQLDLGDFVLEAGGQRWGIDLGAETDRAPGFKPAAVRTARYDLYLEGTPGQNTLLMGGNQELDAKAHVLFGHSSPDVGVGVVDLTKAYPKQTKDLHRGAMVVRGATPYLILQDDMVLKNTTGFTWAMHTKAEVAVSGNKATLTQGGQKLTAVILSPANATFSSEDAPEPKVETMKKLTGIRVLKASVPESKGAVSLSIQFVLGETPPPATVKPIAEWLPKK